MVSRPIAPESSVSADLLDRLDEESYARLGALFDATAARVLEDADRERVLQWFLQTAPAAALPRPPGAASEPWHRALAVAMFEALPLPPSFRVRRATRPGRNDPCPCGSGTKYKQCCAEFASDLDFSDYDALEHVLKALPPPQYAALVRSQVDTGQLADIAGYWLEEGEHERAIALLQPWFAPDTGKFTQAAAPLLMCYIDALIAAGRPDDATAIVTLALARGDRPLRGAATRARAYARLDAGDIDGAWEDFAEVRRLTPSDPTNATLELTILIDSERYADAQARARYWLPRLERNPDREADAPLEFVKRVIDNPETALDGAPPARVEYPELAVLEGLLMDAPPVSATAAHVTADGELELVRDAALRKLETRWSDVFPVRKPAGVDLLVVNDEAWDAPERWLAFLRDHPDAWRSIEVLDDLVLVTAYVLGDLALDPLLAGLLKRACELVQRQVAPNGTAAGRLDWDLGENRAPLRLLAFRARRLARDPAEPFAMPAFFALCEQLLVLDPVDHHGVRALLAQAYLMRGEPLRALALGDPDPEHDIALLNHVLALHLVGREADARAALAEHGARCRALIAALLADTPPQPEPEPVAASSDEAFDAHLQAVVAAEYRGHMRSVWENGGALAWLAAQR